GPSHTHVHANNDDPGLAHGHANVDDPGLAHGHVNVDAAATSDAQSGLVHDHGEGPHCPTSPVSGGLEPDHAACSVSDSSVAASASIGKSLDPKVSLSPAAWFAPVAPAPLKPNRCTAAQDVPALQLRPLTIRYCVLLL